MKGKQMNKKILYVINIPSAIVLLLALSKRNITSLAIACIIGLIIGIGEAYYLSKSKTCVNKYKLLISILIGALICYKESKIFFQTWLTSNALIFIITRFFSDYSHGLRLLSILFAIVAIPSATIMVDLLLLCIIRLFKVIDYKCLWHELVKDISGISIIKRIGITILQLTAAALAGSALLTIVYTLPVNKIDLNVEKSAYTIQKEGTYPHLVTWATSQLDNWTDSIMLMESANSFTTSPVTDAMNVPRGSILNHNPFETIVAHYVSGAPYERSRTYPRYWHGYLVFLKPLLAIIDYETIRIINGVIQLIAVILVCMLLYKKGHSLAVGSFIIAYLMLMPFALAKSIQFSSCFYVFIVGCLSLLLLNDEKRRTRAYNVFLFCGILTAFFDFLTYPISTFGVPMLFYLFLSDTESTETKLCATVKNGLFWCIGFIGMWVSKWIISSIITGNDIIENGIGAVVKRTSSVGPDGTTKYSIVACEIKNYTTFLNTPVTIVAIVFLGYLILKCIIRKNLSLKNTVRTLIPFLLTGFAPIVWYAFATNHSMIHYWFTNKACVITVLSIFLGIISLLRQMEPGR